MTMTAVGVTTTVEVTTAVAATTVAVEIAATETMETGVDRIADRAAIQGRRRVLTVTETAVTIAGTARFSIILVAAIPAQLPVTEIATETRTATEIATATEIVTATKIETATGIVTATETGIEIVTVTKIVIVTATEIAIETVTVMAITITATGTAIRSTM
jgi:hypothetical protein